MTMTDDKSDWTRAYEENEAKIRAHPDFHRLVREVAIAEQPTGTPWRLRNSPTYATWYTKGSRHIDTGPARRRVRLLCEKIVLDTGILAQSPQGDREAAVYVSARGYVRDRHR